MSEIEVQMRQIRADEGLRNREIRIRMLTDSPDAFGGTLDVVAERPDDYRHERAALLAAGDRRTLFVADDGERWRGVAGGVLDDDGSAVEVIAVWVDPLYRGRGYGRALVERVMSWGIGRGARHAFLWVHERNGPAIALYSRLGFLGTDLRKPLGTDGQRMQLFMERTPL